MRSSIACTRCRRSKIKCVNSGIDSTCRACASSNRDCLYPTPATGVSGGATKRDITATTDGDDRNGEWDSPKRPRSRKTVGGSGAGVKDATKANIDLLDSSILTAKAWETLLDLFQSHFATILPFLNPTTFLSQIRQLSASQQQQQQQQHHQHHHQPPPPQLQPDGPLPAGGEHSQSPAPKPEPSQLILLGVLALTARFHPTLVAFHSPASPGIASSNPLVASEYYASVLRSRLIGADGSGLTVPDLTRVQALLMLAWHEWGMCRGRNAWMYAGTAIRLAQSMGLPFELENETATRDPLRASIWRSEPDHHGLARRREPREQTSDEVIAQETKRRTFWACFIIDRCLSTGKYRPRMVKVRDLDIQLPSDNAFAFGERVRTSRLRDTYGRRLQSFDAQGQIPSLRQSIGFEEKLRPNGSADPKSPWSPVQRKDSVDHEVDRWEVGAEESVLSRVIRILKVWGRIAKWACVGGRRNEEYAPWQVESRFSQLRAMLAEFQDSLPRNQQYSQRNTDTHIMYKHTLASYTAMHMIYFLSVIVLHRVYLPFLPFRCTDPVGPLDEPLFPRDKYSLPDSFWRDSAKELFRAARQMMDLAITCQERGVLVETPLVGFAIYHATFVGVYAAHFGHMDQDDYLSSSKSLANDLGSAGGIPGQGPVQTRKSLEILRDMKQRLTMAVGWYRTIHRLHNYYSKVKKDYRRNSRKLDLLSPADGMEAHPNGIRSVRDGGTGVDDLKLLEKLFQDCGYAEDQIPEPGSLDDDGTGSFVPMNDRGVGTSDTGSNAVRSESGEGGEDGAAGARRESWVPVNSAMHGLPLPSGPEGERSRSDLDRRPSLPLPPTSRSVPSQYGLPSLQHHAHGTIPPPSTTKSGAHTTSPSLPSLTSPGAFASPPTSQPSSQYLCNPSTRLQPLNPWITSPQPQPPPPPYSQSLPPINATAQHGFAAMLPPPGVAGYTSTPASLTFEGADSYLYSASLGGDDVIAFVDGGSCEQWPTMTNSEVGHPTGWLSAVWNDLM